VIVLDACVLIAFADPANVFHADACRILTTTEPLIVSALTGAEIMVHPSTDQRRAWRGMLNDLAIEVVALGGDDMEAIADARRVSGLRMPDAIVFWLARTRDAGIASFDQRLLDRAGQFGIRIVR